MVVICTQYTLDDRIVYTTSCERCSSVIGELDAEEVLALSTGRYGKVLCFECESVSCKACQKELTDDERSLGIGVCWFCQCEFADNQNITRTEAVQRIRDGALV